MQNLPPPESLKLEGNKQQGWRKWKQRWQNYAIASGLASKPQNVQSAAFLHVVGNEGMEVYENLTWEEEGDSSRLERIMEKFDGYFAPKTNVTFERHVFNTREQKEGETIDDFVKALQTLAKSCAYGQLTDSLIKDRIVAGLLDSSLRERLLEKADLTLDRAVQILKAAEATRMQAKVFVKVNNEASATAEVDALYRNKQKNGRQNEGNQNSQRYTRKKEHYERRKYSPSRETVPNNQGYKESIPNHCRQCGLKHEPRRCPAYGTQCFKCKGYNHYARMCRRFQGPSYRNKRVSTMEDIDKQTDEYDSEETLFIGTVRSETSEKRGLLSEDWHATLNINKHPVVFKLDSGAQCNIIPKSIYDRISNESLKLSKVRLKSYTNQVLHPIGETEMICVWRKTKYKVKFQVVDGNYAALIGRADCERLGILTKVLCSLQVEKPAIMKLENEITKATIIEEFKDVFEGLGSMPGTYTIQMEPSAEPVVHPPRRVPHALREKLKIELDRMESQGIIEKVPQNEPSDWVHSMVIVEKPNGEVRLCIDPKDMNKVIKREHHPLKTVEEIAARVEGSVYFSKLDAKNAFHQIILDEKSSKMLTFNSAYGRYRYLRLPMGLKSSPEVYQRRIQQILEGLDGVDAGMDDILVWGKTQEEHNKRLLSVLQRIRQFGLKLNKEKCIIQVQKVKFLGHLFTSSGLQPNINKCKAIVEMPKPETKDEVKRFMGMVNYFAKFIPNMSEISAPLRVLLKKETEWHWSPLQEESYQQLKNALVNPPVLAYYEPNSPLTLQVDASGKGVGAALIQNGKPIAYASKALSTAQQGYAQIEKELLAILFGCTRFEDYIIGRETVVESDHKPLSSIMKKPLCQTPVRLQRMLVQLQRFAGIEVVYKQGSEMHVADALSRAYIQETLMDFPELQIDTLSILPISKLKNLELIQATGQDPVLQTLKTCIVNGWPENKQQVSVSIQEYWNYRDELTVTNELLFKGQRLIVPLSMRKEMLTKLHQSHLGIVKTKQRARDIMFWPRMNSEIEDLVRQCETCLSYQRDNIKEPMASHTIPNRPWAKVGSDLFAFKGKDYLLCVDYFSKFPEVIELTSTTSIAVIQALKNIFSRHGIPDQLVTDQGPQYKSQEFCTFAKLWDFQQVFSSPHYPQSNGQSERTVQTIKNLMRKATDPDMALLEYRNTPIDGVNKSPAQLLMSRRLKSILPTTQMLLMPKVENGASRELMKRQEKQKQYFDRQAKELPELNKGEDIKVRKSHRNWERATVHKVLPNRAYIIQDQRNKLFWRNRRFLQKLKPVTPRVVREEISPTLQGPQDENNDKTTTSEEPIIQVTKSGRTVRRPSRFD